MKYDDEKVKQAIAYFETTKSLLSPINLAGLEAHNIVLDLLHKEHDKIIAEQLAYTE
jgi:hypothetical protein